MEVLETLKKEGGWHLCVLETNKGIRNLVITDWNITYKVLADQKGKEFILTLPEIRLTKKFKDYLKENPEKIFCTYEKYSLEQKIISGSPHGEMYKKRLNKVQKRLEELKCK